MSTPTQDAKRLLIHYLTLAAEGRADAMQTGDCRAEIGGIVDDIIDAATVKAAQRLGHKADAPTKAERDTEVEQLRVLVDEAIEIISTTVAGTDSVCDLRDWLKTARTVRR